MRLVSSVLIFAALAFGQSPELDGAWRAVFTDEVSQRPIAYGEMTFQFLVAGDKLTGKAHIGNWPGDCPLVDGSIVGDRFEFTVYGNNPWRSGDPAGQASGLPRLIFRGSRQGAELQLTVTLDSVMIYGPKPAAKELHMAGKRVTQ